jgi:hypothetical protein
MGLDPYYDYMHALASESSGSHDEALKYAARAIAKDEFVRNASKTKGPVAGTSTDPAHVNQHVQFNNDLKWLRRNTKAVCVSFLDTLAHASFMLLFFGPLYHLFQPLDIDLLC